MRQSLIIISTVLPLLAGACHLYGSKETVDPMPPEPVPEVKPDSTTTYFLSINLNADFPIRSAQILVYRPDGLKDLACAVQSDCLSASIELADSLPKIVAVVANSKYRLNTAALGHIDSLDGLTSRLEDEDPAAPVMSGMAEVKPGEDTEIRLTPLLCTVILSEVTNLYEGDTLAEDPRVWIENAGGEASLFRDAGFPVKDPMNTRAVKLPSDIGIYTQRPGTHLYCYPNDLPNPNPGNPATEIVMQYETKGETHTWRATLHPIGRGETIAVEAVLRP